MRLGFDERNGVGKVSKLYLQNVLGLDV